MAAKLEGKVAIITGGSSGLGEATVYEFAKNKAKLVICGRNKEALSKVRANAIECGLKDTDVVVCQGELEKEETLKKIVQTAKTYHGKIDILFNCAGYTHKKDGPIHMNGRVDALDAMYNINLRVPYLLIQEALPQLIETKGVIINMSGGSSKIPVPNLTSKCVIRAAVDHFTRTLAITLGMKGIRVNCLKLYDNYSPGFIPTAQLVRQFGEEKANQIFAGMAKQTPLEQSLGAPEDIAKLVTFLASDDSRALSGASIICDRASGLTNPIVDFTQY